MMSKPNALQFYHGNSNYNCAQAVLKAYTPAVGVDDSAVDALAGYGGGRAPGGVCGALYVAKALVTGPAAQEAVEQQFLATAGATVCQSIRRDRRATCQQCVAAASDAVYAQVEQGIALQWPAAR